jgi:ubiquitin-activating enzyme E1
MGSKGNTQVVYPEMTESYSSSVDPPEKSIPICTLKNFPNEIQHTIQWARDLFEGIFTNPTETVNQYLENPRAFLERIEKMSSGQQMEMFDTIKRGLIDENPKSPEACITWARKLWQQHYHESIAQLLHNFPPDQVSNGVRFWSGTKRCPHALNFDVKQVCGLYIRIDCTNRELFQEEHFNFVYAASILRAQQYNLTPIVDKETVASIAAAVNIPKFEPRSGVKIAVTDAEAKEQNEHQDSANGMCVDFCVYILVFRRC